MLKQAARQAIRSDGEYKFDFYCLTTDLLQVKQAYSGKGLAAKGHKLTVNCHYSQALGTEDTQDQTLGSFQSKLIRKIEVISQNLQKWKFFGQKIHDFEFSKGYHYSHTLEDTQEKTLGSFQPKLMTKIEVISQKPSKTRFLPKMTIFFTLFGQKIPNFEFSHRYHYSHTLVDLSLIHI